MNGKKIACVVLMLIIAGVAYGTQMMQKRSKAMNEEAEMAETDAKMAEGQREVASTKLQALEYESQDLRQFLKDWEPLVRRVQSSQEADQSLQSLLRNSGILTVSQKFEVKDSKDGKMMAKVLQGTLVVQDEYSKTLNWLGELERKLPFARVTVCRLKQGETGRQINLELHFEVPIVNLDAKPEEVKK